MCDQPGVENVWSAHTPDGNGERHTQCGDSCNQAYKNKTNLFGNFSELDS